MKSGQTSYLLVALFSSALLSACATDTPNLDAQFGSAVNQAKALQTINPDASMDTDPVAGIDGASANEVIDNYQQSYEKPATRADRFSLGTGAGGGSSGGSR